MATTQLPPPTVGTPLHEWSQETANALASPDTQNVPASHNASANPADADPTQTAHPVVFDPAAKVPAAPPAATALHHAPETPGPVVPGAFPRTLSDEGKPTFQQQFQQQAGPVLDTLQETLGKAAQNAAQYLPQSVKETVAPYLPEGTSVTANASHNDSVHKTSYPTTEVLGAGTGEQIGGAGALPGRVGEEGVAKLPEERIAEQTGNAAGAPGLAERAAGYLPQSVKDTVAPLLGGATVAAVTASASEHDKTHTTSLPSTELTGAGSREHVDGVGALPGRVNDSSVALLPDERTGATSHATVAGNIAGARDYAEGTAAAAAAAVARGTEKAKDAATGNSPSTALTTTSTAVAPHPTQSLPTTEHEGLKPGEHVGGAGPLPGSIGERGVAVLPGENDVTSLPTTERQGTQPGERSGGAGALPGALSESGVAVLPEERYTTTAAPTAKAATGAPGPVEQKPDTAASKDTATSKPNDTKGLENRGDGYQTDYHPAALHPADGDYKDVKVGDGEKGAPSEKANEGTAGAQPEGLKEGGDRKLHGGVPGDVGGGTMPVGDDHEGGIDSTDPKGKADGDSSPTKSKFMDKAKGFMHKIAHPKSSH